MDAQQEAGLVSLLPLAIISLIVAALVYATAKRKGQNPIIFALVGLVPVVGPFVFIYLVGITDKAVYDRLEHIEELLSKSPDL